MFPKQSQHDLNMSAPKTWGTRPQFASATFHFLYRVLSQLGIPRIQSQHVAICTFKLYVQSWAQPASPHVAQDDYFGSASFETECRLRESKEGLLVARREARVLGDNRWQRR